MRVFSLGLLLCCVVAVPTFAQADLRLALSGAAIHDVGSTAPLVPGGAAGYFATVTNGGPGSAQNLILTLTFPQQTQIFARPVIFGAADAACTTQITAGGLVVTCTQLALAASEQMTVSLAIVLDATFPAPSDLVATAAVTSTSTDPNITNNQKTATIPVVSLAAIPTTDGGAQIAIVLCLIATALFLLRSRA